MIPKQYSVASIFILLDMSGLGGHDEVNAC